MDEKVNLKVVIRKLLARWYYFFIALLIIVPLAYAYIKYAPKKYHIRASILLMKEEDNGLNSDEFMKGMGLFTSKTELEDEIGILKSYSMMQAALHELDFGVSYFTEELFKDTERYGNAPFTVKLDSTVNQMIDVPVYIELISNKAYRVVASATDVEVYNFLTNQVEDKLDRVDIHSIVELGKPFVHKNLAFSITFDERYRNADRNVKTYFQINNLRSLAEYYKETIKVEPISLESNIVELSLKGTVPHKEVKFLDRVLDMYLKNELYKKNQLGLKTIQFIDNQLSGVSDSLKQVQGSLELFRSRNNILDINTTAQDLTRNLTLLEKEKAELEVKLKYYRFIASSLQEKGSLTEMVAPSTFGVEDPLLSNLLIEMSKLNQEKSGLKYSTREGNPLSEVIDLKIENNRKALIKNVDNFIDASSFALNDLESRISQINQRLSRLPRNERELVNIQRKFDFSDNVYNYLLEKRAEAGIAIASNTVESTIVDSAKQVGAGPISPNPQMIYALALFIAFAGAAGMIVLKDFFNENIINHEDIKRSTRIPFIGTISHGSKREQTNIVANAKSPLGESFRSLRVNLQYLTLGKENNVIGFTSSAESEGKTFCSVNLAAAMAQAKRRTVLIDADLRKPKVGSYFQLENKKGLSSYLIGYCSMKEIIYNTGIRGFDVVPSGPIPPNPLDLIGHSRLEDLINELRQSYSTIILDSPPIGYVSEYIILMKYTDANIYVVRSDYTSRYELEKINKLYEDKKISNISILLNDVKPSRMNGYHYKKYKPIYA